MGKNTKNMINNSFLFFWAIIALNFNICNSKINSTMSNQNIPAQEAANQYIQDFKGGKEFFKPSKCFEYLKRRTQ